MSQELIELIIFGEIININEMVYFDYYTIYIFIVILLMVLINKKINQEIYELRNFINFEINNLREQNIVVKSEFTENINNINCKIDKEIINIIEDMNYKFDILKAKFNSSELSRDELFKTFNEKIDENSVIMNSVIERIDNFELNSQNNNIVIGIYYGNGNDLIIQSFANCDAMRCNHGFRTHNRLYVNILRDNIDLSYYDGNVSYETLIYTSELFKLKNLKKIILHHISCGGNYFGFTLIGGCKQSSNILNKEIFSSYKGKKFQIYGLNYYIYCSMGCIAKLLKLKIFYSYGSDCTELAYEQIEKFYSDDLLFLKLFFKEMGYISS